MDCHRLRLARPGFLPFRRLRPETRGFDSLPKLSRATRCHPGRSEYRSLLNCQTADPPSRSSAGVRLRPGGLVDVRAATCPVADTAARLAGALQVLGSCSATAGDGGCSKRLALHRESPSCDTPLSPGSSLASDP